MSRSSLRYHSRLTVRPFLHKVYDVDGGAMDEDGDIPPRNQTTVLPARRSGHNDRFYEEHEYERRVRKRKARLVSAAEDAFTHIKRMHDENGQGTRLSRVLSVTIGG